ncbi:MAG: NAD(P)-binding domain-containing protein [Actinomycetota bacterium]|nr:NAD(P)-binding domain-containing protein [Actinomycetota bacterium]
MKIAVIGTGNVGRSIGNKWHQAGYDVVFGTRSASGAGAASASGVGTRSASGAGAAGAPGEDPGGAAVLGIGDALVGADVVLLALPGSAAAEVIAAQSAALAGKTVIDAVNRIGQSEPNCRSLLADAVPNARYVRAFNTLGWENFADPVPGTSLFFVADPGARYLAEELIAAVGLDPAYVGDAGAAGTVDALLPLWFALVKQHGGNRRLALSIVTSG